MATTKITDLTAYTDPVNTDVLPIVDVTSDVTKKVSVANVMKNASLGTAAAPGISFDGDPNTGIYSPGADQVAISTGGSGRLFVNSSGNTGFGTSSPNATGFASTVATINIAAGSNGGLELTKNNVAAGHFTVESNANNDIRVGAVGASAALTFQTAGSERLRITSAGLVGVGTSSPSRNLDIAAGQANVGITSNTTSAGNEPTLVFTHAGNNAYVIKGGSNLQFASDAGANVRMTLTTAGSLGIGTSSPGNLLTLKQSIAASSDAAPTLIKLENGSDGGSAIEFSNAVAAKAKVALGVEGTGSATDDTFIGFSTSLNTTLSEKVRITSAGNVGIGTTSPSETLHVSGGNSRFDGNYISLGNNGYIRTDATNELRFQSGSSGTTFWNTGLSSEMARFDTSGRLLVGTSTALTNIYEQATSYTPNVQFASASQSYNAGLSLINYSGLGYPATLTLGQSGSNTLNTNALVGSGNCVGSINFVVNDGTNFRSGATVQAFVDASSGSGDVPTRLVFSTTSDSASSPTERARITSSGELLINRTTRDIVVGADCKLQVLCTGVEWSTVIRNSHSATPYGLYIKHDVDANTTSNSFWVGNGGGVNRGYLASNGGLYNYSGNNSNLCDEREKKNIENLESTWDCLKHWELKKFHYNEDADTESKRYGVIAQQVEQHCPEVITEWTKGKDEDGEDILRKGVKEQQMYWMAIKALQEAQVRIEALEVEVAALKAQ